MSFVPRHIEPGAIITEPGIYANVPIMRYHGGDLFLEPSISSSGLRHIFIDSPMDYWIESPMNPHRREPKEKEAFILGRATHHLVLSEPAFKKFYAPQPLVLQGKPWHGNRNACKDWLAEKTNAGMTILTPKQWEDIQGMCGILPWQIGLQDSGLSNHPMVQAGILNGLIEHSIVWRDEETGIWIKVRPDAIPTSDADCSDLKTTRSVSYVDLERTLADYRYDMQASLIRHGMRKVLGLDAEHFSFVFVTSTAPYSVRVVEVKPNEMDEAEKDIRISLRTLRKCLDTGRWPGPGGTQSDAVWLERPVWAKKQAEDRRAFLEQDLKA